MQLFSFEFNNQIFSLEGNSFTGMEWLYADGQLLGQKRNFRMSNQFEIELPDIGPCVLHYQLHLFKGYVAITLTSQDRIEPLFSTMVKLIELEQSAQAAASLEPQLQSDDGLSPSHRHSESNAVSETNSRLYSWLLSAFLFV